MGGLREAAEERGLLPGAQVGEEREGREGASNFSEARLGRTTVFLTTLMNPGFFPRLLSRRFGAHEKDIGVRTCWKAQEKTV